MADLLRGLAQAAQTRIVLLVMDGLGGLPREPGGPTELEAAATPNLDDLARRSALGLLDPVYPAITPGSGPGHLALFGYDPVEHLVGRGILSAFGVGLDVGEGDVALRGNFATLAADGTISDRRAGRIPTQTCRELCARLAREISRLEDVEVIFHPEKEHRLVVLLRGEDLSPEITDTDPQKEGRPIAQAQPRGSDPAAVRTARILNELSRRVVEVLRGRETANAVLLRGADRRPCLPSFRDRFGLRAAAIATYPMYRGLARLAGMDILPAPEEEDYAALARTLRDAWDRYDFFFVHVKKTDSYGEDGDFEGKMRVIERVDAVLVPAIRDLAPAAFAVTADHSTPAVLAAHSWHPVPLLLHAKFVRGGADRFGESACARGELGRLPSRALMGLLLAHAGRLAKYGA